MGSIGIPAMYGDIKPTSGNIIRAPHIISIIYERSLFNADVEL
jgi:hypothetical protein